VSSLSRTPHPHPKLLLVAVSLAASAGCSVRQSRLEIIDFAYDGSSTRLSESFDEAYYDVDRTGNLDLILRRVDTGRAANKVGLTQVVHIRSLWRSIPGETIADDGQINATVTYALVGPSAGHAYDGAGSVFFTNKRGLASLAGSLGHAIVKPSRSVSSNAPLFTRAEISGSFHAVRDPRQVQRIKNDLRRQFGSPPRG